MQFVTLFIVLSLFIHSADTFATSRSRTSTRQSIRELRSKPSCLARARFVEPVYKNEKVYWTFELQSTNSKSNNDCPSVEEPLQVLVWGAQHITLNGGMFVYPEYIEEPQVNSWKKIRIEKRRMVENTIRREYDDWMITNWNDGIRPDP